MSKPTLDKAKYDCDELETQEKGELKQVMELTAQVQINLFYTGNHSLILLYAIYNRQKRLM